MCLGIQLWTDCRELRELQMLSALSAPLASPLYSANWPEVKNSLGWPGRDWFTDFMYKVNTLSGGELNSLHHILTSYLPPDLSCYFNPAIFNTTACFCLTGVTQVKRWSNYPNMWFIFKKKKKWCQTFQALLWFPKISTGLLGGEQLFLFTSQRVGNNQTVLASLLVLNDVTQSRAQSLVKWVKQPSVVL